MDNPFKWRHYESAIIILCVHWYLRYALSYRDLAEMMSERGLSVAHPDWKAPKLAEEVGRSERWARKWLSRFKASETHQYGEHKKLGQS